VNTMHPVDTMDAMHTKYRHFSLLSPQRPACTGKGIWQRRHTPPANRLTQNSR
jgi:hypothetical protein